MARLSSYIRDAAAMQHGEWINPGPEFGGIEVLTRAVTSKYHDHRSGLMRRAARIAGGENKISTKEQNRIDLQSLIATCLLDVRNLEHDPQPDGTPGTPVTFAEFCELILQEEARDLANAAFAAALQVGNGLASQLDDAAGN